MKEGCLFWVFFFPLPTTVFLWPFSVSTFLSFLGVALSAGAVEYVNCTSAEGYPPTHEVTCWPSVVTHNA